MTTATKSTELLFSENIGAAWQLFKHDLGVLEVRALLKKPGENSRIWEGWGETISGYFDDYDAFAGCVANLERSKLVKGVYVTMNPVLPALMGRAQNRLIAAGKRSPTTSDDDIVSRKTLLIDADPFRPAEIASTQAEMEAAIAKRDEVAAWLYSLGFPAMHMANSGNGAHLLGRIDLPNNNEAKQLVNDFLECLDWKFGTVPDDTEKEKNTAKRQFAQGIINVGIDTTVYNASRITKLYGTAVRKGDNTADRPHRRAQLTFVPEQSEVIPAELLERVAQEYRDHKEEEEEERKRQSANRKTFSTNGHKPAADWAATSDGVEQWLRDHGVTLGSRETYTSDGYQYKWAVDCLTCGGAHKDGACILWGAQKGLGYKCHHNSCKGRGWADVRNIIAPKTYTGGRRADGDSEKNADEQPAIGLDEILDAIGGSVSGKRALMLEIGPHIAEIDRQHDALIADALVDTKLFTLTGANTFIRGCVADHKKRQKAAARCRAEQARENLLAVRASKNKASIDVGNRQLSDIVDEALQVLIDDNAGAPAMFVRGGALVRVVQDERGLYGIQEFSNGAMMGKLAAVADWETVTIDADGNPKSQAVFPPRDVVSTLISAAEWPGIPALTGVVTSPVLSRGGTLHDQPGYNPATRLYYTGGVFVGDTTPTPANIESAKDLILNNLLVDFPFKDEASRAHAVAYLLLPFVRDMIDGPSPVHVVDSPTAGTGKGKLLNACALPFLGHDAPTMPAAKEDDEWRKRITSSLLNGSTHLIIDNVNHELDSGSLASAFTQPVWEDRALGSNRQVKIPIRTIWGITANNILMSQELARRGLWIRLDANVEKPWERTEFKHKNLIGWAKGNRDALVTAAVTFVRAWVEQGMPRYAERTKGSYESWAGVIGGILNAVGIPGFLENETELYERVAPKVDMMGDFILAWADKFGNADTSAHELFKLASYADDDANNMLGEWQNLLGDLLNSQKQRGRQTQLGRILNDHRDKVVAGYKIVWAKFLHGSNYWRLESIERGEPQNLGEPQNEGSPDDLPVVEPVTDNSGVNLGEPFPTATRGQEKKYHVGGQGKNIFSNSYRERPAEVHPGSPNPAKNGTPPEVETGVNLGEPRFKVLPGKDEDAVMQAAQYRCQRCETSKWSVPLKIIRVPGGHNVLCEKCHDRQHA